jgi:hypothetical protein
MFRNAHSRLVYMSSVASCSGRCGEFGRVVSVVSYTEADALQAWSKQLGFSLGRVKGLDLD